MPDAMPPRLTLRIAALFYGVLFAIAVAWAGLTRPGVHLLFAMPAERALPWWLAGLLTSLALIGLTAILESRSASLRRVGAELAEIVAPITWTRAVALALLSGVAEEALFRGPLQFGMVAALGLPMGYALTSLGFALLHGGVKPRYLPWSTFALLAGLTFGGLALAYGSPWPAALAHVVVNAVNLRRLARYVQGEARDG
jgi:membrane protease YdiL (CAAX protease family)